ncbi:MAG TPA: TlpA disulfide reductase family protein [Pedobacter sp.]
MKRVIGIILLLITVLTACKKSDEFTIDGQLENFGSLKKVAIYKADKLLDSAILNADGKFKFHVASPDVDFYYIAAEQKTYPLIAQNGDELEFKADYANEAGEFELSGSDNAERLKEFNKISSRYGKVYLDIQKEYQDKVSRDPSIKESLEATLIPRFEKNMDDFAKETIQFSEKNKDNLAGFYAISSLDQTKYEPQLLAYANSIRGKFANTKAVQEFLTKMDKLNSLSVGKVAPDFEMASVDGKSLKLSQFRGQYVLLDFWASWCGPCREENPNVVKQYNAFKNKGFTVLGVSLDNNRDLWLKAIKDDNLTWNHVSELKQWDSNIVKQYSIEGIPMSFLLDKEGKIIGKNLHGQQLEEILTRTLN